MTKFFKKLKSAIKTLAKRFLTFVKHRYAYFIGIIFTWVIPIFMLNESIALVENVEAHLKLTFLGAIVAVVVVLALRKKIYALIYKLRRGIIRGVLLTLYRAVGYGLLLVILWGLSVFSTKLYSWWLYSGISMLIGAIFYIVDEAIMSKKIGGRDAEK